MSDDVQVQAARQPRAADRNRVIQAAVLATLGLLFGGALFQTSAIAFDYMKVREFPLHGSASSLPKFADAVRVADQEMEPNARRIRGLLRDRATIDLDIAEKSEDAELTLSQAKTFLRPFVAAELNFAAIDAKFQLLCLPADNAAAAAQTVQIEPPQTSPNTGGSASTAEAGAVTPPRVERAAAPQLTAAQRTTMDAACRISDTPCDKPDSTRGVRHRMICAQQALQTVIRRKKAISTYDFDDAKYLSDALRITYPAFSAERVVEAAKIAEVYNTTVGETAGACRDAPSADSERMARACPPGKLSRLWDVVRQSVWNWGLSWPLAVMYLVLAFVFGVLGSLARYLYQFAAEPIENPKSNPGAPMLAGGGAAVLVLMIVMAGFQFLTVGASSPDLAYPNPLTVCGLGVISGLAGERVLAALQRLVNNVIGGAVVPPSK
jgi:hypothetical protein